MTITCSGDPATLEQIIKQLAKLVDVVHAIDHTGDESYEVEIALIKLHCPLDQRTQILQIAEHYKARVVDFGAGSGVAGIAAGLAGARSVVAVDTDPAALTAAETNARSNGVELETRKTLPGGWDLLLASDVLLLQHLGTILKAHP